MEKSTQKKRRKLANKTKSIIKGIVLLCAITVSLMHIILPAKSEDMISHKKTYKPIINERDNGSAILLDQLETNKISKEDYIAKLRTHLASSNLKIKKYNEDKKIYALEHSFNGRNSLKYWFFVFGLALSFFVLSLKYVYSNVKHAESNDLKISILLESVAWITVSFFWLLHSIVVKTADFGTMIYLLTGVLISILVAVSIVFFIKYSIIKQFFVDKSVSELISLISDLKVNHYFKMASKALNSNNKKRIKADAELVDEKIINTLDRIN